MTGFGLFLLFAGYWCLVFLMLLGPPRPRSGIPAAGLADPRSQRRFDARHAHQPRGCDHWPRDPVTLYDGTQVSAICRRNPRHVIYNEEWINGQALDSDR